MGVQILSYDFLVNLTEKEKINKILKFAKEGDIVLLTGQLKPDEEVSLIQETMKSINKNFTGVEIAYIDSTNNNTLLQKIKKVIVNILLKDRIGITVIGPSKIIKEIKRDPNKINQLEILTK